MRFYRTECSQLPQHLWALKLWKIIWILPLLSGTNSVPQTRSVPLFTASMVRKKKRAEIQWMLQAGQIWSSTHCSFRIKRTFQRELIHRNFVQDSNTVLMWQTAQEALDGSLGLTFAKVWVTELKLSSAFVCLHFSWNIWLIMCAVLRKCAPQFVL